VIPAAVAKAVEVALEMALPRDARIVFERVDSAPGMSG